ncbi:myotubularin, putative [Entamoeba histolytica HM-1:IMSS-B]|uniref:Myotubularin, putative n=6 Tax=Entamoeba histolytica TaxID=5759 RepID=C4LZ80_ENTH1|nr:myotubularin, putative [Entamoeba histolytica HM-1:IMSS]EMD47242.1 myotubularin, putative [Entamoeba histolytica KU27]EMH73717.1 myotubularin, putative [Entamoeba histolytica HM-1:IMSS-B]EMS16088.1 myotubularin, putative [Entamoeba histolytica HM-3:IMSS]ENY62042.1 myotubularin, putative [Entamoeba histolytica HM-1:IMSS-A]GAT94158.1 myotubularin putative [Entamoeba histolytica]|eukprot:XP_650583.1 myotubularin, putative [Entamoeba histolytica HM-1:IMSS]
MSISRVRVVDPLSTPPPTTKPIKSITKKEKVREPPPVSISIISAVNGESVDSIISSNSFHFLLEGLTHEVFSVQPDGSSQPLTTETFDTIEIFGRGGAVVHITCDCREIVVQYQSKYASVIVSPTTTVSEVIRSIEHSLGLKGHHILYLNEGRRKRIPLRKNTLVWGLKSDFTLKDINVIIGEEDIIPLQPPFITSDVLCIVEFQNIPPFETIVESTWNYEELVKFLLESIGVDSEVWKEYDLVLKKGYKAIKFEGIVGQWAKEGVIVVEVNKKPGCHVIVVGDYDDKPHKCLRTVEFYRQAPTEDDCWAYASRMSFTVATSNLTLVTSVAQKFQAANTYIFTIDENGITNFADAQSVVGNAKKMIFVKSEEAPGTSFCRALEVLDPFESVVYSQGDLLVTKYRTILVSSSVVSVPHASVAIAQVFIIDDKRDALLLIAKDLQRVIITGDSNKIRKLLKIYYSEDNRLLFPRSVSETYAFRSSGTTSTESEWRALSFTKEFSRLGITSSNGFKVIDNRDGHISVTYPPMVAVPDGVDISSILTFRSKGRIPAICWRGAGNQTISRSAQPLPGALGRARCEADELLLKTLVTLTKGGEILSIFDARPPLNAQANRLQGGGVESNTYYPFCEFQYLSIENIHEVRNAYYKMLKAILMMPHNSYEYKNVIEGCKWYQFLHSILVGAVSIVNKIKEGNSVLVHCSDGWDRTSQLTSLAMIILDPYYRTVEGLLTLIEKEWITFGHRFKQRSGLGCRYDIDVTPIVQSLFRDVKPKDFQKQEQNDNESSPIYGQWIECVEIIRRQQPDAFEYNGDLLIFLLDSLYNCQFANYLEYPNTCSCNISNLLSMVPYVYSHRIKFTNTSFKAVADDIKVSLNPLQFKLWKEYYLRYDKPVVLNI